MAHMAGTISAAFYSPGIRLHKPYNRPLKIDHIIPFRECRL